MAPPSGPLVVIRSVRARACMDSGALPPAFALELQALQTELWNMEATRSPARWRAASRLAPILLTTLALAACFDDNSASDTQAGTSQAGSIPVQSTGANAGNAAPVVSGTPSGEIPAGFPYVFKPTVSDPDGDAVTLEVVGAPRWATFDAVTGELRGTPADADVGDVTGIVIRASDGKATTAFGPFSVRVKRPTAATGAAGSRPPTISGTPATSVAAGSGYAFQALGADPDGDRLTFGATNLPAWLGINTANGILSGTPSAAQAGVYANITISVTDGNSTASLPAFTITVTAGNGATSSAASWTQCASEGGNCAFSGTKLVRYGEPFNGRWAAARTLTGPVPCTNAFWGDPSPGTGKRCEIVDSLVVDPSTSTTTPTTNSASVAGTGTATLVWQRPSQNTDGSPLVDLAGFIIKYGTDPASLSQTVTLTDPAATRHTLQSLGRGTWYFTVASLTASGVESDLSPLVSKTIL
jgi:Putative Ig domain